jgi:hypothetical protein
VARVVRVLETIAWFLGLGLSHGRSKPISNLAICPLAPLFDKNFLLASGIPRTLRKSLVGFAYSSCSLVLLVVATARALGREVFTWVTGRTEFGLPQGVRCQDSK